MTIEEMQKILERHGYRYGHDASQNAAAGYQIATEELLAIPAPCGWDVPEAGIWQTGDGRRVPVVTWDGVLHEPIDADEAEALGVALIRAAREARKL